MISRMASDKQVARLAGAGPPIREAQTVRFRIALPGNNHIPPANDHVPEAADWVPSLAAPDFQDVASVIDGLRYDAITTSEHLAMPYEEVPRLGPYWMHALSVMAFVSGATKRVRVDASVLVLPYYHPLALAKALSTIDVLSGGRLDVSIGVGHAVQEFEVLGVAFDERGAITDEILEATLTLWSEKEPKFHSGPLRHRGPGLRAEAGPVTPAPDLRGRKLEACPSPRRPLRGMAAEPHHLLGGGDTTAARLPPQPA